MTRRRRPAACEGGCGRAPRKRRHARYCSPCIAKQPKVTCTVCGGGFQADQVVGRRCRPCISQKAHDKRVAETYGLAPGQYAELLAFQGGRCYICRRKPASKRLAVDHDHGTGEVRGLLCRGCNRDVLGHLRDDIQALWRAMHYLEKPPARALWGDEVPIQPTQE